MRRIYVGLIKRHFQLNSQMLFLVVKNNQPWFLVEAKLSANKRISNNLEYFQKQLNCPHAFQVVMNLEYINEDCFAHNAPIVVPAKTFLSQLV